jgi:hypothetical protein
MNRKISTVGMFWIPLASSTKVGRWTLVIEHVIGTETIEPVEVRSQKPSDLEDGIIVETLVGELILHGSINLDDDDKEKLQKIRAIDLVGLVGQVEGAMLDGNDDMEPHGSEVAYSQ